MHSPQTRLGALAALMVTQALPAPAHADEPALAPPPAEAAPPAEADAPSAARPSSRAEDPFALRPSVMMGVAQWTLWGGGNVAAQVKVGRVVFEYSHGQGLHFDRVAFALTAAERDAGVKVGMPWTTGGGVGFQITPNLHVMVEAKAHRYEIEGARGDALRYTSFTVGPGVFYDLYLYKGLFVQPNLRWWPTVASTYDDKGVLAREGGGTYQHERHDLVPFVNVNVGWTFAGK
ncbi:MAG: hypothetical protein U0235_14065 [Polyangiaceae bacterium]